jgi:hypothetical protein
VFVIKRPFSKSSIPAAPSFEERSFQALCRLPVRVGACRSLSRGVEAASGGVREGNAIVKSVQTGSCADSYAKKGMQDIRRLLDGREVPRSQSHMLLPRQMCQASSPTDECAPAAASPLHKPPLVPSGIPSRWAHICSPNTRELRPAVLHGRYHVRLVCPLCDFWLYLMGNDGDGPSYLCMGVARRMPIHVRRRLRVLEFLVQIKVNGRMGISNKLKTGRFPPVHVCCCSRIPSGLAESKPS